ncbi:MAG: hypothetical protein JKX76_02635 [Colwellia sp.]|nr:hypothetical protein [Colwellia sp.]
MNCIKTLLCIKLHFRQCDFLRGEEIRKWELLGIYFNQNASLPSIIDNGDQIWTLSQLGSAESGTLSQLGSAESGTLSQLGSAESPVAVVTYRSHYDGPSIIRSNGTIEWRFIKNGPCRESDILHCCIPNHPSIIRSNGDREYRNRRGDIHRPLNEGPAIIYSDGLLQYYEYGLRHRPYTEGPAVIYPNGDLLYFENDYLHRYSQDGPAIVCGHNEKYGSKRDFCEYLDYDLSNYCCNGDQLYFEHGNLHRPIEEGPAIIKNNGDQFYYHHGEIVTR